ncbi:MAG: polysaccharide pyruvyl transferase family protein [Acutalibacteraceae bacterium]|nr:polysaccharide pyruvyl transferase family protein [Acutalibacteraceae bacterium]
MKKIGILTFHRAINYGAQLQAYALQRTVTDLGAECELVDYICPAITKPYRPIYITKDKPLMSLAKSLIMFNRRAQKSKSFESFQNKLVKSETQYFPDDIQNAKDKYDVFITGSDQVFSPWCADFDPAYFLTFADDKQKYAYAASFATKEIPDDKKAEFTKRLSGFQKISVREHDNVRLVKELCQKEAVVTLDPTILLSAEKWSEIAECDINEPYVFVYSVMPQISLVEFACKLAKEKNMKVVFVNDAPHLPNKNIEYKRAVSVERFVGYIKNASYVVSNSFHATAFSAIFHKSMFIEFQNKVNRNVRSEGFLASLGISRGIENGVAQETEIDWNDVDIKLNNHREKSLDFLREIINTEQN